MSRFRPLCNKFEETVEANEIKDQHLRLLGPFDPQSRPSASEEHLSFSLLKLRSP